MKRTVAIASAALLSLTALTNGVSAEPITCYRERDTIDCPGYGRFPYNGSYSSGYYGNLTQDINRIYQDVLGRAADRNGLNTYSRRVRQEGWTIAQVRADVAGSAEATRAIHNVYRQVLGRNADSQGLEAYRRRLIDGANLTIIRRELANSPEARNRRGGYDGNFSQDINRVYLDVLGRAADRDGLNTYGRRMQQEGWTLSQVRADVANSAEATRAIHNVYRQVLGRDADPQGLNTYRRQLVDGGNLNDIRRELANSPEARNRRG